MFCYRRLAGGFLSLQLIIAAAARSLALEESSTEITNFSRVLGTAVPFISDDRSEFTPFYKQIRQSRIDLPRQARVSRSHRFLYQFTLLGGDRFLGECLSRDEAFTTVRLQSKQTVRLPTAAIVQIANPPGELDVLYQDFHVRDTDSGASVVGGVLDQEHAVDGRSSLRLDSSSREFQTRFDPHFAAGRVEFSFLVSARDSSTNVGEWRFVWGRNNDEVATTVVELNSDATIAINGTAASPPLASLRIGPGWHTFLMLARSGRLEFLVDDSLLATIRAPAAPLYSLGFRPADQTSGNSYWIDELHVRRFQDPGPEPRLQGELSNRDMLLTATGDELFGRIIDVSSSDVQIETLGQVRSVSRSQLISLNWPQTSAVIGQSTVPKAGVVAIIEMQPFVDRPDTPPERWAVTIRDVDAKQIRAVHPLIGDMTFSWKETLRVIPQFFGETILIDARRFHLGNSIRADFHRQLPDGTEISGDFEVATAPKSTVYFSLEVAELEAAGPRAPLASPFLPELRRGQLVTEVLINERSLGDLNSQVRFKASAAQPDRVRLPIPDGLLKPGRNSYRLKQHSLEKKVKEFDDCEVGHLRLEIEPGTD